MLVFGVSWTDALPAIVTIISLPIAIFALLQTRAALTAQKISNDLQTALALWEKIDAHWQGFRTAESESVKSFEFGQLMSYYEMACALFKDKILSSKAARTLEEHLDEILPVLRASAPFKERIAKLTSTDKTFENVRWFCDRKKAVTK